MFTFYDDLHGVNETAWNICFNEVLNKWITHYSWIPSQSANIDNIFFSFDRNTSKAISKLGTSSSVYHKENNTDLTLVGDGIVLNNVLLPRYTSGSILIGKLDIVNRSIKDNIIKLHPSINKDIIFKYELLDNLYSKSFRIIGNNLYLTSSYPTDAIIYLHIKASLNKSQLSNYDNLNQHLNG